MLSGKNYNRDQYDLVWRGTRQVGSAFKPFTLAAAFEQGFPPGKVYSSKSPLCNLAGWISASGCVSNAEGGGDGGYLDLWSATQDSVNVVFAQLALDVGPEHIVDVAHRMGITVPLDAVPSITLGVEEVPVMDMAAAFGTLANDGKRCNAWAVRRVEFANVPQDAPKAQRVLYQHEPECEQVIKPEIAHLVTAMLQRVVCCGTGHRGEHRATRGRQDRHRPGLHERVLRRLYAAGLDGGLGRVRERPDPDGLVLRRVGVRWHRGRADLARLHGQGDGGLPGGRLRGAPAARERTGPRRRRHADRAGREAAGESELHADPRGRAGRSSRPGRSSGRPPAAAPVSSSGAR
jgi:Membrane carboxypeptidase (penicillin-binding protein)